MPTQIYNWFLDLETGSQIQIVGIFLLIFIPLFVFLGKSIWRFLSKMFEKDILIKPLALLYFVRTYKTAIDDGIEYVLDSISTHESGLKSESYSPKRDIHDEQYNQFIYVNLSIQNIHNLENHIKEIEAKILKPKGIEVEIERSRPTIVGHDFINRQHPFKDADDTANDYLSMPIDLVPTKNYTKYVALKLLNLPTAFNAATLEIKLIDKNDKKHKVKIKFTKEDNGDIVIVKSRFFGWLN